MTIYELLLIGISLSADAFSVAVCRGLEMKKVNYKHALVISLFFGGFQALMPLIGYLIGFAFKDLVQSVDHWIAFGLLALIGGNMIFESIKAKKQDEVNVNTNYDKLNLKRLLIMAIATSIDALAIGVTLAFSGANIYLAIMIIGVITFILSFLGVVIGNKIGNKLEGKAEIIGGIVLMLIGVKILLEHLGILKL